MKYQTIFTFHCERRDLLCNHSNGDLFTCEDIMFRAKAHLVFNRGLYYKVVFVRSDGLLKLGIVSTIYLHSSEPYC